MARAATDGAEEEMNLKALLEQKHHILILGHQNADPDAICSMIAFQNLYNQLNPVGDADYAADDVSRLSLQVLDVLHPGITIPDRAGTDYDLYVLLDTNSRFQLGENLQSIPAIPEDTLVIDHHEPNPDIDELARHTIVKHECSSACEIIAGLYKELSLPIPEEIANLLLTGLLFDTRRFFYADPDTFKTALALIEAGADYNQCVRALIIRPDRSERIARLTAAGRLKMHTIGEWIVVASKVKAFEASACRGLLDLGADVAIIGGSPSKNQVRLSSRSSRTFSESTGINLGTDVMAPLGELIDGAGGGHANAAGANGTRNLDEALRKAVALIRTAIEGRHEIEG